MILQPAGLTETERRTLRVLLDHQKKVHDWKAAERRRRDPKHAEGRAERPW